MAQDQDCGAHESYDDFNFWLGAWDVYVGDDMQVGTNLIEKIENGCALMETWSGAGGSSGISINYFNPAKNEWRQVWVSAGEYAIDIGGGLVDESMVLEGEIYNYVNQEGESETFDFRGTWTPNNDGSVGQFFEQYNDETETWDAWFDGRYVQQEMSE